MCIGVIVKIMAPYWVLRITRHPVLGTQKGIVLTTTHMRLSCQGSRLELLEVERGIMKNLRTAGGVGVGGVSRQPALNYPMI